MNAWEMIEQAKNSRRAHWLSGYRDKLEELSVSAGCVEPGCDDKPMVFGNWNPPSSNFHGKSPADQAWSLFQKKLELADFELEWSDEWSTCSECNKAFRISADCYGWTKSYFETESELVCLECADPDEMVESCTNKPGKAILPTWKIDLSTYDFAKLPYEFEYGFHVGQNADARRIYTSLRKRGITRVIFEISDVGQFDTKFAVWVPVEEEDKLTTGLGPEETDGKAPSLPE